MEDASWQEQLVALNNTDRITIRPACLRWNTNLVAKFRPSSDSTDVRAASSSTEHLPLSKYESYYEAALPIGTATRSCVEGSWNEFCGHY